MGFWKLDFSSWGCVALTKPRKRVRDPKMQEGNREIAGIREDLVQRQARTELKGERTL